MKIRTRTSKLFRSKNDDVHFFIHVPSFNCELSRKTTDFEVFALSRFYYHNTKKMFMLEARLFGLGLEINKYK
jgi:hypothetical protein